ncbi:hypothetical protein BROOK1789C_1524 [Bathymodiolus brooksi thiotrophic gill symbiont]|nr:hypothetical protein BROOK1789C_1524 [Bathymodiolus brooksi thiotrophic gill symbiont]
MSVSTVASNTLLTCQPEVTILIACSVVNNTTASVVPKTS